ncbi:MAG TPA: PAS domain S-box protein [Patescibacteria group bacterium]|nr:PAS domain S-box protein [Patescibacteria group bacterium]
MINTSTLPNTRGIDMDDLRSKAEKLAKNVTSAELEAMSTWDVKKLIQELQVHQVELEMQNEQLVEVTTELQKAHDKYSDLYDFAPVGYMTIEKKTGVIAELNLAVTQLLGVERSQLKGSLFTKFISPDSIKEYLTFFKSIFDANHKQMCELWLKPKTGKPFFVRLEGVDIESPTKVGKCCQIAIIDIDERKKMEEELDRQVRQRTAELEHANALLIAEVEERKKWQKDSELLIAELQNAIHDADNRHKVGTTEQKSSNVQIAKAPALTQSDVLQMTLKEFCDKEIDPVFGSRFWRYFVNSKKSYEPMFPMHELIEFTVQDFMDDMRCKMRIKKHYNNETLEKAIESFAKYNLMPFGNNN